MEVLVSPVPERGRRLITSSKFVQLLAAVKIDLLLHPIIIYLLFFITRKLLEATFRLPSCSKDGWTYGWTPARVLGFFSDGPVDLLSSSRPTATVPLCYSTRCFGRPLTEKLCRESGSSCQCLQQCPQWKGNCTLGASPPTALCMWFCFKFSKGIVLSQADPEEIQIYPVS